MSFDNSSSINNNYNDNDNNNDNDINNDNNNNNDNKNNKKQKQNSLDFVRSILSADSRFAMMDPPDFHFARTFLGKCFAGSETASPEPIMTWHLRGIPHINVDAYSFVVGFLVLENRRAKQSLFFGLVDEMTTLSSGVYIREVEECKKKNRTLVDTVQMEWNILRYVLWMQWNVKTRPKAFGGLYSKAMKTLSRRGQQYETHIQEYHHTHGPKEPHWYVAIVGTLPECQGQGKGRQVMMKLGDMADSCGKACYLECAGERNVEFYKKVGYEVAGTKDMVDGPDAADTLKWYCMIRFPQPTLDNNQEHATEETVSAMEQ